MESIGDWAFDGCSLLTSIAYEGKTEPTIGDSAFPTGNAGITVTVPENYDGDGFGDFSIYQIIGKTSEITITQPTNGSIKATVNEEEVTSVKSGDKVTLVATPEDDWMLDKWTVTCGEETITVDDDNTFTMPFGNVAVSATFQRGSWNEETKTLTVTLGETTEYSSYKELAEHLVIKAGTNTEIPASAFRYDWKKVEDICIESGVTAIGNYAFADCTAKTVDIPESVESIGDGAFAYCTLTEVTIPRSVKSIGQQAFQECTALTEVTIPGSVKSIGQQAFSFCSALEKIIIEEGVESIGDGAFAYCTLTEVTIPGSVKSIGQDAFYNCSALKKVTIEEGVESIGVRTFCNCSNLTEITIPESVTDIGKNAFEGCTSLKEITIPSSVASIKGYTFQNCSALTNIVYKGTTEPEINNYAFLGISPDATVTVPENYDGDGFGDFSIYQIIGKTSGITITPPTNGSISAQRNGQEVASVESGDVVKVVATPEEGYELESLTVKDRDNDEVTLNDDNTFTMPFDGVTISATFTKETTPEPEEPEEPVTPDYPDYYNIYVDECEGVTVLTSTNVVREGNSMTFTVEVAEGYTAEDMVVKVKRSLFGYTDVIEPNEEGKYEVRNIYSEIYITIEGVTEEETPTGIEELPQAKVYAKEGSLYVETPQCETVTIVSMTGAIVGQSEQIGLKRYDLPRGIYIIGIGTERYKVRI